ncbi:replication-relaxation family protein [Paenibacillus antri]|nr:replication-relaxation family protein [Paenibacillus antri]
MSERESNIMLALARLRFMTTRQIHQLYGYAGSHGLSVTRRRLHEMESAGWVKSWQPSKYEQKIYYLSRGGALELEYRNGAEGVRTFRKSERSIHYSLIAEVFVRLRTADPGILRAFDVEPKFEKIVPDAYVELALDSRPFALFLELDRNTESAGYLRDVKMEKYRNWYATKAASSALPSLLVVTSTEYRKTLFDRIIEHYGLPAACYTIDEFVLSPVPCVRSLSRLRSES